MARRDTKASSVSTSTGVYVWNIVWNVIAAWTNHKQVKRKNSKNSASYFAVIRVRSPVVNLVRSGCNCRCCLCFLFTELTHITFIKSILCALINLSAGPREVLVTLISRTRRDCVTSRNSSRLLPLVLFLSREKPH